MTVFHGARDLLDITNAITEPRPIRRRHVGRYVTAAVGMLCIAALTLAALVVLP